MSVTAEDLCAFLLDLDAPDRLERPHLLDAGAVSAGVARLSEALGAAFGRSCGVERLPEGKEHFGSVTVPGEVTSAGAPIILVVGWYGLTVAFAPNHRHADGSPTVLLDDSDYFRAEEAIFSAGFALSMPGSGLTPGRPDRPYPRLFPLGTAEQLLRQIRSLPTGEGPTAELRAWLCATLDVPADGPADERLTSLAGH
nr:hypothetical protein [Kibdelosporangium sp. MJ126-NF4]CEL23052.1 hypothetical protein [Kibdelosporangium sp. MJ126-NF4]CTQ90190.1 hypothetical protein [Kibdelosporangium sp. MJ126-NF4]